MDDEIKNLIEKYKDEHVEIEQYFREHNDQQVSYTSKQIEELAEKGYLPKELWDYHCRSIQEINEIREKSKKLREENPNLSQAEFINKLWPNRVLSKEETYKFYEDSHFSSKFLMWLMQNHDLLNSNQPIPDNINKTLFENIDCNEDMGIVLAISDSLYHLGKILNNMEYIPLYENMYIAKGSFNNSIGETITLEYTFRASSENDAKIALQEYKNIMLKKGLRTWMAYWCAANEKGRVEYECKLVDIMKWMADEEREVYFQTKEKDEFWRLTKMLGLSKLSRSKIVKKRKKNDEKEYVQWIEQPLIEIFGGERLLENKDQYPDSIAVRVLMPKMSKKGFAPAFYKTSTLKLNPNDTFLAFILQTRAFKMDRGERKLFFEWDYLFEIGNLKQTAVSNSRMAKAKMRIKMDNLKEKKIIEKCDEDLLGMSIHPSKNKKVSKKK